MICVYAVGGIYTVIRTKAAVTVEELGDRYFLIGPYNESCVRTELDIMEPPNEAVGRAFQQMREHGLKVCASELMADFFADHLYDISNNESWIIVLGFLNVENSFM